MENRQVKLWWTSLAVLSSLTANIAAQGWSDSVERIRAALQRAGSQPAFVIPPLLDRAATIRQFGPLTLVPPEMNGEIVRVAIPIGDLTTRATRALASARRRRAERKADERVARAL